MRWEKAAAGILIVALSSSRLDGQVAAVSLSGRVIAQDGSAIVGAEIVVEGSPTSLRSDSIGHFLIERAGGSVRLHVRAIGFFPLDTTVTLGNAASSSIVLRMTQTIHRLAPVVTEASLPYGKPARYRHTSRFDDFYERRAKRPGVFFTREDIENSGRSTVMELMSVAPGVRVSFHGNKESIRIPRCVGSSIYGSQKPDSTDRIVTGNPTRWLAVYIDGQRMGSDPINALSQLKAEDVETVEFYRGPSQLPMEAVGDACAAIFITTRFTTGSVLTNR